MHLENYYAENELACEPRKNICQDNNCKTKNIVFNVSEGNNYIT